MDCTNGVISTHTYIDMPGSLAGALLKKARESIPSFSPPFPSSSLSSPSFPLSCWPSGSFLEEVNKSAMRSADTGGGGPLIGPVSIPAVLSSVYLFISELGLS